MPPVLFRSTLFKASIKKYAEVKPHPYAHPPSGPITGFAWEHLLYSALCDYHESKKGTESGNKKRLLVTEPEWNPESSVSGVDVKYDGQSYSCKGSKYLDESRVLVTPSYRLNRCESDADAILEIDRPHRYNFDWYALLAREHVFVQKTGMRSESASESDSIRIRTRTKKRKTSNKNTESSVDIHTKYDMFLIPASLTKAAGFDWTYHTGVGKLGDINSWETQWKNGVKLEMQTFMKKGRLQRRLYILWDLSAFKKTMSFTLDEREQDGDMPFPAIYTTEDIIPPTEKTRTE